MQCDTEPWQHLGNGFGAALGDLEIKGVYTIVIQVLFLFSQVTAIASVELPDAEDPKNVVRVGWSTDSANLQLGKAFFEFQISKRSWCGNCESFLGFGNLFSKESEL